MSANIYAYADCSNARQVMISFLYTVVIFVGVVRISIVAVVAIMPVIAITAVLAVSAIAVVVAILLLRHVHTF